MKKKRFKLKLIFVFALFLIIILITSLILLNRSKINQEEIREAKFSGTWYPANQENLEKLLEEYFNESNKINFKGEVKAVIVPHAGYIYSGKIAASVFNQLEEDYETVFLIGPSHNHPLKNVSVSGFKYYSTPLGNVEVSEKSREMDKREEIISTIEEAHGNEHSLEIELPFLQYKLNDFEIVPLLVGQTNSTELKEVLMNYLDEEDLIVVSVDLSHYHEYNEAITLDSYSVSSIMNLDTNAIFNAEIDAPWAVASLLEIAKEKSWKPYLISYTNSGEVSGDKTSVVGYSGIVFVDESEFNENEKEFMLNIARESAEEYLNDGKKLKIDEKEVPEKLKEKKGCFVTLTKEGQLRGCIGDILPQKQLYECVIENSINAAVNDPRFSPLNKEELEEVVIDVSVLSIPVLFEHKNYEELLSKLGQDKYGVVLINGVHQSTFLPSVWEFIPHKENFLGNLCIKGEMDAECWKDPKTEVYLYTAEDFSE